MRDHGSEPLGSRSEDDPRTSGAGGRRSFLRRAVGVGAVGLAGLAGCTDGATAFPSDDVRFVVPFAPGGGFDEIARLAEPYWETHLPGDASLVVDNVEGGGSAVGTGQVYDAEPDGHTLLFGDPFSAGGRQVVTDPGYDIPEMRYVGHFSHEPHGIAAAEELGLAGWDDFVDRVDEFNVATQGRGSVAHLAPLLLAEVTGAFSADALNFVHYTGTGEAIAGLERGEVDVYPVGSASSALVARALDDVEHFLMFTDAKTGEEFFPETRVYAAELDVPNVAEYIELSSFQRFVAAPPGVPDDILETLREAMDAVLADESFREEALAADRFLLNTAVGPESRELAERKLAALREAPFPSVLEDALGE